MVNRKAPVWIRPVRFGGRAVGLSESADAGSQAPSTRPGPLPRTTIIVAGNPPAGTPVRPRARCPIPSGPKADRRLWLLDGDLGHGALVPGLRSDQVLGVGTVAVAPIGRFHSVTGIEGNVSDIQARATIVTTKEGREVIIPNAVIFTNPVAVGHNETPQPESGK